MKRNFRKLLEENRWIKKVPNTLTICNSLCGFAAILYILNIYNTPNREAVLGISAWIILFAMVFDALDGFAARILNAASVHGLQMDSLSDMVTFGVAPAVLVSAMAHSLEKGSFSLVWLLCAVYIGCAASRLATYNVHAMLEKKSGEKFSGLPTPGAAAAICSLVIFCSLSKGEVDHIVIILPFYAAILGLLMISEIQYTHMGRWILSVRRNKKRLFILFVVLAACFFQPELVMVLVINLYVFSGPFIAFAVKLGLLKNQSPELNPVEK